MVLTIPASVRSASASVEKKFDSKKVFTGPKQTYSVYSQHNFTKLTHTQPITLQ